MSRIDTAREAASRTREQLTPYAVSARDTAAQYGGEAWQKVAPAVGSAVEQARAAAQTAVQSQVVPLWEKGRGTLPPAVDEAMAKAARQAALQARVAARQAREAAVVAADQARAIAQERVLPAAELAAQEVHDRSLAALPALRGQVSLAEVEALTAAHAREASRRGRWARRGFTLLALGVLATGGLAAWKWYRKQSNPDWLVEPPTTSIPLRDTAPNAGGSSASGAVNGSLPLDPEVEAKEAEEAKEADKKKK
ncbi:DUF5324 family protein [Streptacidiphilus jiangxiensis]|uniref:Uncharacterized protein n=1 Tax=Streptacidiphilus jiangxiensis TaxID=235985 RepID=A0A1H7JD96_STRJI|nr:DUF5324 family protein [Streptacidiphilus jiangxiensis]SEK72611.1 hypothetical protein SAMN05414137_103244 [Streptacidiphilus jiangxiensis]